MITVRLYNRKTNKLTTWFKSELNKWNIKFTIQAFTKNLDERKRYNHNNYIVYTKEGKIIAREARYKGI